MEISHAPVAKLITVKAMVSRQTGLVLAECDQYRGLSVFGNSFADVESKLSGAIRDHFEMLGYAVESGTMLDSGSSASVFDTIPASISAQAMLVEKGPRDAC